MITTPMQDEIDAVISMQCLESLEQSRQVTRQETRNSRALSSPCSFETELLTFSVLSVRVSFHGVIPRNISARKVTALEAR
jgi:hypothetical protein